MAFNIVWGVLLMLVGSLAWLGQLVSAIWPKTAERLGLTEAEDAADPVFNADVHAEACWDLFTLWALPVAGGFLIFGHESWLPLGLIGGGVYVYFAGRGIAARITMLRRKIKIGTQQNVRVGLGFLAVWGVFGLGTIGLALMRLTAYRL
jgi:hypothetical protein